MGFSGTLGLEWDWRSGAGSLASLPSPFPFWDLTFHLSQGCQGDAGGIKELTWQSALCFEGWGAQAERVECHSEEEPHKCLNMSPFLPLLMSDLRVLIFLSPLPPSFCGWGEGLLGGVRFPKHLASSLHILKWQFDLECKVEHLLDIFSMCFIKLYIWEGIGRCL